MPEPDWGPPVPKPPNLTALDQALADAHQTVEVAALLAAMNAAVAADHLARKARIATRWIIWYLGLLAIITVEIWDGAAPSWAWTVQLILAVGIATNLWTRHRARKGTP